MSTEVGREIPPGSLAYAESMYRYAAERLDAFSLRCWIVRRLMLDDGLGHESAVHAFEHALDVAARARSPRSDRARRSRSGLLRVGLHRRGPGPGARCSRPGTAR
jgi:hypothetical protein